MALTAEVVNAFISTCESCEIKGLIGHLFLTNTELVDETFSDGVFILSFARWGDGSEERFVVELPR